MIDYKSWLFSKGVWGSVIALVGLVLPLFGYHFGQDESTLLGQSIDSILTAFGTLLALYGRVKATKMIGSAPTA